MSVKLMHAATRAPAAAMKTTNSDDERRGENPSRPRWRRREAPERRRPDRAGGRGPDAGGRGGHAQAPVPIDVGLLLHGLGGVARGVCAALGSLLDLGVDRRGDLLPGRRRPAATWRRRAACRRPSAAGRSRSVAGRPRRVLTAGRSPTVVVPLGLRVSGWDSHSTNFHAAVPVLGVLEDGQVAAADERRAGLVLARHRRDGALVLDVSAGVLVEDPMCHGPEMNEPSVPLTKPLLERALRRASGSARALVEERLVVVERLGHLRACRG